MHNRDSYLLKIRTAAALCAVFFLCACSYEITEEGDDSGGGESKLTTVTLSVSTAAGEQSLTTKGMSDTEQNAIHTLYILAFQPAKDDALTYRLKYYATGRPVSGNPGKFDFSLRRSESGADTKLLLIANFNPYPLTSTGKRYDEVKKDLIINLAGVVPEGGSTPAFTGTGIPMFGYACTSSSLSRPDSPLEITAGMTLTANLLRAVARVDVGVGTYNEATGVWNKEGVNFTLTEIHVFKPQNSFSLLPLIDNLEYDSNGTPSVTSPSPAGEPGNNLVYKDAAITNTTDNNYCKSEIYLPEVDFGEGTVYDGNHDKRMALVIGGTYNNNTYYYRIDFTTARSNATGNVLNNVLRNHIYRFSITNVNQAGYTSAELAYAGKPVGLDFTAKIVDWVEEDLDSPAPDMFVRMNFKGINGTVIKDNMFVDGNSTPFTISKKKAYIETDEGSQIYNSYIIDYNNFNGEAKDPRILANGGHYSTVQNALDREGPFGNLVIAPDNAAESIQWRSTSAETPIKQRVLNAYNACRDYRGQGQSDWRLPRLSELMLLWMNKVTINSSKGFTSLGDSGETYWTGSEGPIESDKVYTVDRNGNINLELKSATHRVRCVRQVRRNN